MRLLLALISLLSTQAYSLAYTNGYIESNTNQGPQYYVENGILFPTNIHFYLEIDSGIQTESYAGPDTLSTIGAEYRFGGISYTYYSLGAQSVAYNDKKEFRFLARAQYKWDLGAWVYARAQLHVDSGNYNGLSFWGATGYDFGPALLKAMYMFRLNDHGQNKSSLDFRASMKAYFLISMLNIESKVKQSHKQ